MKRLKTTALALTLSLALGACAGDLGGGPRAISSSNSSGSVSPMTAVPAGTVTPGTEPSQFVPPNDEPYDTVFFDNPGVNPFIDTEDDALSTFALDVDTGSYTIARRFLADGFLPDKDSVRVEEYVNYFEQDYPAPEQGLAVSVDGGPTPFTQNERNRVVRIGVQAAEPAEEERGPANLVFVVDASGSMDREDRLGLVKEALARLVANLRPDDTVGIVAYQEHAWEVLQPTPASDPATILGALHSLAPNGSTNAAEGLTLGYRMADEAFREDGINRVILCSDGVANTGDATGPESILELIRGASERSIELVTVGFGMGNYNDVLMEQLADQGDGFYAYVDTLDEADRLFVDGLTGTLVTVAKDARIQVQFDPETVQSWRLIGFENRAMADEDFRDDSVDAGEIGAGHTVTALYEIKPTDASQGAFGSVYLRWLDPATNEAIEVEQPIERDLLADGFESTSPRFQQDVVVAQFAEVLRESIWARQTGSTLSDVAAVAQRLDTEGDPKLAEFVGLVQQAAAISS